MCFLLCGALKYVSLIFKVIAALILMVLVMLIFGTIGTVDQILNNRDVKQHGTNSSSFDHVVDIVRESYATKSFPDVFTRWALVSGAIYFALLIVYVIIVLFNVHRKCANKFDETADAYIDKQQRKRGSTFYSMRHGGLQTDEASQDVLSYSNDQEMDIIRNEQRQFLDSFRS